MDFDLRNKLARKRRQMLNDDIFELNDMERDSPSPGKKQKVESSISEAEDDVLKGNLSNDIEDGEISIDTVDNCQRRTENNIFYKQNITKDPQPVFHIVCRNKDFYNIFKDDLMIFKNSVKTKLGNEWCESDFIIETRDEAISAPQSCANDESAAFDEVDEATEDPIFMVDTDCSVLEQSETIPLYNQSKTEIGGKVEVAADGDKKKAQYCFNCEGDHTLKDCPKPKDYNKINEARQQFLKTNKVSRYHKEEAHKYHHLKPGKLSESLRYALRLHANELPLHIYRMREIGYPPGWLEEARVTASGLAVITDSNEIHESVPKDSYNLEKIIDFPGFNVSPLPKTRDEYRYFGCPPQQAFQSKENMLKMLKMHSKVQSSVQEVVKKPVPVDVNINETDMEVEEDPCSVTANSHSGYVMYPQPFSYPIIPPPPPGVPVAQPVLLAIPPPLPKVPPPPFEAPPEIPPPPPTEVPPLPPAKSPLPVEDIPVPSAASSASVTADSDSERSNTKTVCTPLQSPLETSNVDSPSFTENSHDLSLSLAELEMKKQQLLLELQDNTTVSDGTSPTLFQESDNSQSIDETTETKVPISIDCTESDSKLDCDSNVEQTPKMQQRGMSKFFSKGTPILSAVSPYSKLPDYSKFSKDISPVINFENLPNSTGRYRQMSNIIKKIRQTIKKSNK